MAGGPSTVDLVVAVSAAGAFGFLAGGYKTADALADEMAAGARRRRGVVRGEPLPAWRSRPPIRDGLDAYLRALVPRPPRSGPALGAAEWDDDDYPRKLALVLARPADRWSASRSACLAPDVVRALQAAGALVVLTVTTPEEATAALRIGPDALCLQGSEAGAHRGSLANDFRPDADRPIRSLLASVWGRTLAPLIAAGGVGGPDDVARPVGPRRHARPGRNRVPALPRERRPAAGQGLRWPIPPSPRPR